MKSVRMADRVVRRGSGFQDEGRTADDDIAARGFAALRSPLTRSVRAPSLTVRPAVRRPRLEPRLTPGSMRGARSWLSTLSGSRPRQKAVDEVRRNRCEPIVVEADHASLNVIRGKAL